MASQTYYCAQLTHGFYKVTIPSGASPTPTVADKVAIGTSVNSRWGIWVFGPTKQEIWVAGNGHATAASSSTLWRSQNGGVSFTNEYSRLTGTPPEQNDVGVLMGIGTAPAGNLFAAGSAAFVGNKLWRAPSPLNGNPFSVEITPSSGGVNQMYAVENPTRLWTTEGNVLAVAVIHYWNGSTWTVASKTGITWRPPATNIGLFGGVWIDAANNRVYIMARDNNTPPHYYVFRKAADAPADPWVEDNYFGAIVTTGWSPRGFGSNFSRQLNGCQKTGAVYMLYSGLANKSTLQRRDPGTGVWSLVKATTGVSPQVDLWVVDDDHLLAFPICKNETGYYEIGVDIPALPGGEQPMAVWGDTEYPDTDAPYLDNLSPYDTEVGVDPFGNIVLEIHDDGDGVNAASVDITVNGDLVWTADAEADPSNYAVSKTVLGTGFRYTINPVGMLPPGTTTVQVYAEDLAP
jgi:hypothetical protein